MNPPRPQSGLLNTADAAAYLHIHPKTLTRLVRAGKVTAIQPGSRDFRFRLEDLDAFVAASVHAPAEAS